MDANSIDAVVTDPPYELSFMGKKWDGTGIAFDPATWAAAYRVLKPGGHLIAFGGSRTYHRIACAIEDAGFEIRDSLMWIYGTGFPKSHDVSKAIDKAAGAVRAVVGIDPQAARRNKTTNKFSGVYREYKDDSESCRTTAPATPEAAAWSGWGSALKPAFEPIILARKPLDGSTIAANVLRHGVGGINIDACRVGEGSDKAPGGNSGQRKSAGGLHEGGVVTSAATDYAIGRFPANVLHDGSDEVMAAFAVYGDKGGGFGVRGAKRQQEGYGMGAGGVVGFGDSGSAARFFYSAKASAADRAGSKHPTVKPLALMRWLCRLVTPPGGRILDPFAGSGTTLQAAHECGFDAIGCEQSAEYVEDINRRLAPIARETKEAA